VARRWYYGSSCILAYAPSFAPRSNLNHAVIVRYASRRPPSSWGICWRGWSVCCGGRQPNSHSRRGVCHGLDGRIAIEPISRYSRPQDHGLEAADADGRAGEGVVAGSYAARDCLVRQTAHHPLCGSLSTASRRAVVLEHHQHHGTIGRCGVKSPSQTSGFV
jgi:hypothetical protein